MLEGSLLFKMMAILDRGHSGATLFRVNDRQVELFSAFG